MQLSTYQRGLVIVLLGVVFLSFDGLLILLANTDGWTIVFWRGFLMFCVLGAIAVSRQRLKLVRLHPVASLGSAILLGLTSVLFVLAVMKASVANVVVILSIAPLFAAIFSRLFLGERVAFRTLVAIVLCMFGMSLVFLGKGALGMLEGNLYALAAAAVVGANLTLLRRYPHIDRVSVIAGGGLLSAAIALPLATPLALDAPRFSILALMGLVQMPLATVLINTATRYLPSTEVALFYLVETALGTLWVWWFLGEQPGVSTLLGGAIVIAVLVLHAWRGLHLERQRLRLYPGVMP
ncbi:MULTISPECIES: DMT family transporter [unclassified Halomonas]|uniref:DMT family transporter n=1 Tax=unclassified Halomonas TaxID=2609666 RepID=UPI0020A1A6C4|nr:MULTISPECIES: DMT family transporter [unclassified Halomonas]MCP1313519.1 DMT family transporter [Halomonas sp. 707D7]MCP1325270.1 DMT family transporter [Halomonas sp. 707D4]